MRSSRSTIAVAATIALLAGDIDVHGPLVVDADRPWIALQPQQTATWNVAIQRGLGTAVGAAPDDPVVMAVTPPTVRIGWVLLSSSSSHSACAP